MLLWGEPCGLPHVLDSEFFKTHVEPLSTTFTINNENFQEKISEKISAGLTNDSDKDNDLIKQWLCTGIASFLYFVKNNWVGPFDNVELQQQSFLELKKIDQDQQLNENVTKPEFLFLAKAILRDDRLRKLYPSTTWWLFRINYIHQLVLEETSARLFDDSETLIKNLLESDFISNDHLRTVFHLEVAQFYLHYARIQSSERHLTDAKSMARLNFYLEGAMGKRTKYQQQEKAQLYLRTSLLDKNDSFSYRKCCENGLPKVVNLSDDLRLDKIQFSEEREKFQLGNVEEAIILTEYFQLKVSQPKDELADEELASYLDYVIDNTHCWSLKISALYQRCSLEANHKRTIERSLSQIEYLIERLKCDKIPTVDFRMDMFFASGTKPVWVFKQLLADLMLNLGMVKSALDIYLSLSLWEDVIVCYTILEMRHKAADIIKQELSKKQTVKLWCLLGDAEQQVEHYETAWKLSGEKSSRAQRHWGLYYYCKQKYKEAIPHLKLSVELNSIQENVWVRLGFAALQVEDWKLAASAYRKYCALEQSSFEVWNNLAKAYIKLGDKPRAWRSLQDAVKCNFDKWEVWDNLMIVSTDLGHFSEVIRCYHRILDLKKLHVDVQVLSILSRAIIDEIKDSEGNSSRRYLQKTLKLFGRLTSKVTTNSDVWRLYAELTLLKKEKLEDEKAARYFQRAYQTAVGNPRWYTTVEDLNKVLDTCIGLAEASLKSTEHCDTQQKRQILAGAKLAIQSVIKKVKDLTWEDKSSFEKNLCQVENVFDKIIIKLNKLDDDDSK